MDHSSINADGELIQEMDPDPVESMDEDD